MPSSPPPIHSWKHSVESVFTQPGSWAELACASRTVHVTEYVSEALAPRHYALGIAGKRALCPRIRDRQVEPHANSIFALRQPGGASWLTRTCMGKHGLNRSHRRGQGQSVAVESVAADKQTRQSCLAQRVGVAGTLRSRGSTEIFRYCKDGFLELAQCLALLSVIVMDIVDVCRPESLSACYVI